MQLASLIPLISLVIAAGFKTALAQDDGESYSNSVLVAKPDCQTMDDFQAVFEKLCPVWVPEPTASDGLYYSKTEFVRGGTDGGSPEYLAQVNCLYATRGAQKNVGFEIVQALGGAIANESA